MIAITLLTHWMKIRTNYRIFLEPNAIIAAEIVQTDLCFFSHI